ncbi:MAG: CPBP family intramembrane metalloprotease [Bacteroidales bacterium]|nr:CPBP family intramembrane metalloprotease [Bacteroidales bacterium]
MKTPFLHALQPFPRILFTVLLIICCLFVFFLGGILLAMPLFGISLTETLSLVADYSNPRAISLLKYLQIIQEVGIFIVPPLLAAFLFAFKPLQYLKLTNSGKWESWVLAAIIMITSIPAISQLIELNETMQLPEWLAGMEQWMQHAEEQAKELTEAFLEVNTLGGFLLNILMIAILPAIGEELLFRGLLQRLFHEWLGNIHIAIILTGVLFGAMHLQFYGILPRVVLGILFGYLFYWSGSLWIPIFAHFLNNAVAVTVSFLEKNGMTSTSLDEFGNTDNLLLILSSFVVTAFALYLFHRSSQIKNNQISSQP